MGLIANGLQSGAIDYPTALLYRLYAWFGDERLPEGYRGAAAEDDVAFDLARRDFATFTPDMQASMAPFLERPSSPDSYWSTPATAFLTGRPVAAAACTDGFLSEQANSPAAIKVWGQCGLRPTGDVAAQVSEAVFDMEQLWTPMTTLMGTPIGDQFEPGRSTTRSPEQGDGLIDIYLVDRTTKPNFYGRDLTNVATAVTTQWWPWIGPSGREATSSYIVIDNRLSGSELRAVIAHEFFHALENSHNRFGTIVPITTAAGARDYAHFWFVEASAKWAEHEFVPEASARSFGPYDLFNNYFQASDLSLMQSNEVNEYASWAWPLYMEQVAGPSSIADAWSAMENKKGQQELQPALDSVLPFRDNFRDFAVKVLDQDFEAGDPLSPRLQKADSGLPLQLPQSPRAIPDNVVAAGSTLNFSDAVWSLYSTYTQLKPSPDVKQLEFDFNGVTAFGILDADVVYRLKTGDWHRTSISLATSNTSLCDVTEAWVVIANHDQTLGASASAEWTVKGKADACPQAMVADLTSTHDSDYIAPDGSHNKAHGEFSAHIVIEVGDYGSLYAAHGSTYDFTISGYQREDCRRQTGELGMPPTRQPQAHGDPNPTAYANIGGGDAGSTEMSIEITIQVGCGWYQLFNFTKGQDGVWHHDEVIPPTNTGGYIVSDESHGTVVGGP